jgi:hypothetical protein
MYLTTAGSGGSKERMLTAMFGGVAGHLAETNSATVSFVVRVESLRPAAITKEVSGETRKVEGKGGAEKGAATGADSTEAIQNEEAEFALKTEAAERSIDLRSQQIEAMNGTGLFREGRRKGGSGASSRRDSSDRFSFSERETVAL